MTWDELNKKYPEARYEMDNERERAFLKDCYSAYETVGFADKFWSPWNIEFEDGHKMSAYPEEIYLNDMLANGYEPETTK